MRSVLDISAELTRDRIKIITRRHCYDTLHQVRNSKHSLTLSVLKQYEMAAVKLMGKFLIIEYSSYISLSTMRDGGWMGYLT